MNGATSLNGGIESSTKGRALVLCFDGTSDVYGDHNTNVVKLFSFLEKDSPAQLVYYQTGIGTYGGPKFITTAARWISGKLDEGFGWTLDTHVKGGYRFLQENYEQGDRICLFGFSRGAYTARALAGMLFTVGLLPRSMPEEVNFAYSIFKHQTPWCANYKRDISRSVRIEFIGVWDTVSSVGALFPRTLPFSADNHITKTFRHALALDEHRAAFQQNNWQRSLNDADPDANGSPHVGVLRTAIAMLWRLLTFWWKRKPKNVTPSQSGKPTHVKEVWFAGCHSDVGGGNTQDAAPHALSNIPLRWMIKEILEAQTGIIFRNDGRLAALGIVLDPPSLSHDSAEGTVYKNGTDGSSATTSLPTSIDERLELDNLPSPYLPLDVNPDDFVQPIQDELQSNPLWWIVEFMPFVKSSQDEHSKWHSRVRFNRFRGRRIPPPPSPDDPNSKSNPDTRGANLSTAAALYHVSVQERMKSKDSRTLMRSRKWLWLKKDTSYTPRAQLKAKPDAGKPDVGKPEPEFVR